MYQTQVSYTRVIHVVFGGVCNSYRINTPCIEYAGGRSEIVSMAYLFLTENLTLVVIIPGKLAAWRLSCGCSAEAEYW